jgi:2-polyprenyl-6-methoxyphenol hydroxylase-like FAD-dependent oxidoreductase
VDEQMTEKTVYVVGGGIAGLAMGRALVERGVPVTVAERSADAGLGGLAINLPGNAVAALKRLGLGEQLERVGRPTRRREYRAASGKLLFSVDEEAFWGPEAQPRCVMRRDLLAMLGEGVPVERPVVVESVKPAGELVEVDGVAYGFVVGADGVRSKVRSVATAEQGLRTSLLTEASWRFMAPNPGVDCWSAWSGRAGAMLLIPVDDRRVYVYASATGGGKVSDDPAWLAERFAGYPEQVKQVLAAPEEMYHSPTEEVRLESWATGRIALIGDAAHANAPVWAQGGALAIEDALVLGELLAGGDWGTVSERYMAQRHDRVWHVHEHTDRFSRAAAVPTWLRDRMLPFVGPKSYAGAYGPLR